MHSNKTIKLNLLMHSNKNIKLNKVIELLKDPKSKLCTVTIAKNSMIKTTYF